MCFLLGWTPGWIGKTCAHVPTAVHGEGKWGGRDMSHIVQILTAKSLGSAAQVIGGWE